ncbi:hypothetical protein V2G26_009036 [Clonostachys chloroleuca]
MLISRLILAVLPHSKQRVLKIPGRRLTPIFVVCDVIAFLVQGSGSGIASSNNWQGNTERIGRYVLIGGLAFQLVAFSLFLCVLGRFHVLANRHKVRDSPKGWAKLVVAVYISSVLIMVRHPPLLLFEPISGQFGIFTDLAEDPMHFPRCRIRRRYEWVRFPS